MLPVKLPVWPNIYQALAWVTWRDEALAAGLTDVNANAAERSYGKRACVGGHADLEAVLQGGRLVAYGSRPSGVVEAIPAYQWTQIALVPFDSHHRYQYDRFIVAKDTLLELFPPLGSNSGKVPERHVSAPPVAVGDLKAWYEAIGEEREWMTQAALVAAAKAAFPNKWVARERVREITAGRKPGPKPIRR